MYMSIMQNCPIKFTECSIYKTELIHVKRLLLFTSNTGARIRTKLLICISWSYSKAENVRPKSIKWGSILKWKDKWAFNWIWFSQHFISPTITSRFIPGPTKFLGNEIYRFALKQLRWGKNIYNLTYIYRN